MMLVFINMCAFANGSNETNNVRQNAKKAEIGNCEISGKVTDIDGESIVGAVIINKATKNGVVSDLNGEYKMTTQKGVELEVLYAGYQKGIIKVGNNDMSNVNVILKKDNEKSIALKKDNSKALEEKLILVDGELYNKPLENIPSEQIEKMTIVKSSKELAFYIEKYGDKATKGVVLIELKK